MFTRFKLLTMVFFFLLSFMLVTFFWGENGYFERKAMQSNLVALDSKAKEREMELSLLRERNEYKNERDRGDLELIYSFDDDESINGYESKTLIASSFFSATAFSFKLIANRYPESFL